MEINDVKYILRTEDSDGQVIHESESYSEEAMLEDLRKHDGAISDRMEEIMLRSEGLSNCCLAPITEDGFCSECKENV